MSTARHQAGPRRWTAVAVIAVLLAAGGLADRTRRSSVGTFSAPVGSPASALSSSWFCLFAPNPAGAAPPGTLAVLNPGPTAVTGTVTLMPSAGNVMNRPITVGARSRLIVAEDGAGPAPYVGALVDLNSGGLAVEQSVAGPQGTAGSPCASAASPQWHFADGSTAKDNTLLLGVLNPFPDAAVVDLAFTTDLGREGTIGALQALPVAARSLVVVDIGQHLRRREHIATSVIARVGRVVAAQLQTKQPAAGPAGQSLELGTPRPGLSFVFPDGVVTAGVAENFHFYNPSAADVQVEIRLALAQGRADPFTIDVPPFGIASLAANHEPRIPAGVAHATQISSTNGVGIVVDRSYDMGPPGPTTGVAQTRPATSAATQWAFALGAQTASVNEVIVVFNPGPQAAHVTLTALAGGAVVPLPGLTDMVVAPGARVSLPLAGHIQRPDLPLILDATAPVVAERDLLAVGGPGVIATMGIALHG